MRTGPISHILSLMKETRFLKLGLAALLAGLSSFPAFSQDAVFPPVGASPVDIPEVSGAAVGSAPTPPPAEVAPPGWDLDQPPGGGAPGQPAPSDSPSTPEWYRFWDNLQNKVFDDVCSKLKIPLSFDYRPVDYAGVGIKIERSLRRYPDRHIALIDHARLGLNLGYATEILKIADNLPLNIGITARVEGDAYVIRPLDGTSGCSELDTLLKVWEFKTVAPVTEKRLTDMKVGELWKLPIVLEAGASLGTGMPVGPATIGVSIGYSQSESASVSLFRLRQDAVRLRIRIDRANVYSGGATASVAFIPLLGDTSLGEGSGLAGLALKQGDRLILRELNRYLANSLGVNMWRRDGRKSVLEFVLDPRDPDQMKGLAQFLKGNLNVLQILMRVVSAAGNLSVYRGELREELEKLEKKNADILKSGTAFAGASDYTRTSRGFHLQVPILARFDSGTAKESDKIISGPKDSALHIEQVSSSGGNAWFDIPFLGQMYKGNTQQTVQAMVRIDDRGMPSAPFMSYIQQEGFVRHSESSAREMVQNVNDIMALAGTRGQGRNEDLLLPIDKMFPAREVPAPRPRMGRDSEMEPRAPDPTYRSAMTAFSLVFNEKAILDILWAPAEVVIRAFANALGKEDADLLALAMTHGKMGTSGLEVDRKALRKTLRSLGYDPFDRNRQDVYQQIMSLVSKATDLVKDLVEARAGEWEARTKALAKIVAGEARTGLEYADVMKVLVQLTDTENIFGEFRIQTNKKIDGEKDLSGRYLLNRGQADKAFQESMLLKERFSEPSLLSD